MARRARQTPQAVLEARRLLGEGRRAEAIRAYEEHLAAFDDDDEARLEYGIACLVNGDRQRFLEVGLEYEPCMSEATLARLGRRVRALWAEYADACARAAAATAVGASVVIACGASGCGNASTKPDASRQVTVEIAKPAPPPAPPPPPPSAPPAPPAPVATQPPVGKEQDEAADAATDGKPVGDSQEKPPKKPPPKPTVIKTRYVAVHLQDDEPF